MERPAYAGRIAPKLQRQPTPDGDLTPALVRLIASPNLCSKRWIWEQYDTTVRTNTIARSEQRDASIVRVKGTGRALAMTSDVNPVYCYLDPYEGGKQAVAEAARNIAASGGRPVAITDCLNFGSPERPEIMWQFSEAIRGISEACLALDTPVVSGNVSFYNETEGKAIYPTPTVGMVGILEDEKRGAGIQFEQEKLDIILLGETGDDLGGSEWQQMFLPDALAAPPRVDLEKERALVEILLTLHDNQLVRTAHDLSNGGLAVALAESSMRGIGCHVDLSGHDLDAVAVLFSESQARAIVATAQSDEVLRRAEDRGVPAHRIGYTAAGVFLIERNGVPLVRTTAQNLHHIWSTAFTHHLSGTREEAPELLAH